MPFDCRNKGDCSLGSCHKLNVFDWMADIKIPEGQKVFDYVEICFKNFRKDFYHNVNNFLLKIGDVVAVEASPGHDIGIVSLTGELVRVQMEKKEIDFNSPEIKKIYRIAKQTDIDKWKEAQMMEQETKIKAREIARFLKLEMKISDVEYQGDKSKIIFYYTAEGRVDFRQLIKEFAVMFRVRIEMRQISLRSEAGRLGGISDCGRELCCSSWFSNFRTVTTIVAKYQQLSINPVKITGQCGKLKCCLNYELDAYMDVIKDFPSTEIKLETQQGFAFHQKTDVFKRTMWFSYENAQGVFIPLSVDRVKEIILLNKDGIKPEELESADVIPKIKEPDYQNVVGQDSISRFDKNKNRNSRPFRYSRRESDKKR
ncbi:MAG: regulatory iron-sulfur-containing complex subunit RicT [Bacteroidota bacterium]